MDVLVRYLLPAAFAYPVGFLAGRKLGGRNSVLAIVALLLAMIVGVLVAEQPAALVAAETVVGVALGGVMGLRHGSGVLFGMMNERTATGEPEKDEASDEAPGDD